MSIAPNDKTKCDVLNRNCLTVAQIILFIVTIFLMVFPCWVRGGLDREYLAPQIWIGIISFFLLLLLPYWGGTSHTYGCLLVKKQIQSIFRDPLFYLGAAFLFQLIIQWWNSGKVHISGQSPGQFTFSPPYIEWLPGAVDTFRSWDMVVWFFPAFVVLLIVRHGFSRIEMIRALLWGMVINSSFLAIFGLVVSILTTKYPPWLTSFIPHHKEFFFSTFSYANHAGSFFILHLGLACGLFFFYYKNQSPGVHFIYKIRFSLKTGILLVCILLHLYAIHMSRGCFAMIFSWLIALLFIGYLFYLSLSKYSSGNLRTIFITVSVVGFIILSSFFIYLTARKDMLAELRTMSRPIEFIKISFDVRLKNVVTAAKIWKEAPLFGVGGGSCREYIPNYLEPHKKKRHVDNYRCVKNIHNEFMQFLCEFGIVGTGLLITIFLLLTIRIISSKEWKKTSVLFGLSGISVVLLHSIIDIPFRSPPVIIAFMGLLTVYGTPKQTGTCGKDKTGESTSSYAKFVGRFVNFYTLLSLFIIIIIWGVLSPIRKTISRGIIQALQKNKYQSGLIVKSHDILLPDKFQHSSEGLLRPIKWARILYSEYKELHLLSAKIYFDLYRDMKSSDEINARLYLKKALRYSLKAKEFANNSDTDFFILHTAILESMGYYLEERMVVYNFGINNQDDIKVFFLIKELINRRPHLVH